MDRGPWPMTPSAPRPLEAAKTPLDAKLRHKTLFLWSDFIC